MVQCRRKPIDNIDLNKAIYLTCSQPERFCIVRLPETVLRIDHLAPRLSAIGATRIPRSRSAAFFLGVFMKFSFIRSFLRISLLLLVLTASVMAAQTAHLSIDASKPGAKIDRNIFGQFAENLGHGLYEGIWVGPDSPIPNTRGIRKDVVTALQALKVPNVRWPGGCFADQYHWRKGIGPAGQRPATINSVWGGVVDANSFGTDEFMDFIQQIGSQAYVSVNVGSGTPQEAAEWLEYMTAAQPTALAKERAANGHPDPYKVGFMGIGNESWSCGGDMTADYYLSQLKIYSRFVGNLNPAQNGPNHMLKIAVGPG